MPVSRPGDASEREAQALARRIAPAMARQEGRSALLPATPAAAQAGPRARAGGGQPLPAGVRAAVEPRLGASLAGVRVHTDADAAARAAAIGARAFTIGADIYFGAGQYQPDTPAGRELIAHELVHTVQQGAAVQRSAIDPVSEQVRPHVQRGAIDWARDAGQWLGDKASAGIEAVKDEAREFFAARAASLPGYRLFRLATGRDPITGEAVAASGAEVLRAIVGIVPLGEAVVKALDNHDIFDRGAAFIARQAGALSDLATGIIGDVKAFIGRLGVNDALRLGELWNEASALVSNSINSVINFLGNLVSDFAALVKDAIVKPLGAWAAANVPHWDLLTGVLGLNPVSDEGTSPGEQLIGAFMALIGQQDVWDNIRKCGAVARAWAWFQGALGGARALVTSIPGRVKGIFTGLTISDLLTIPAVFGRITGTFASFVADFTRWGLGTVLSLLEIILSVVAPAALPYIRKAGGAFATILRNPIGFVGNLVAAGKQGFLAFAANFLTHLKAGLIGWLTGSLGGAGVYIPQGFSARELLKFVASVLGLTWAQLRVRLVAAVGETAVVAMESSFALVKTLVTEGPAAAWQQIIAAVGDLKAMAIDAVMDFVKSRIITVAITRLVMMLNPAGAFIQALLAIWNTIRFFMERLAQIKAVAMRFIDSIAAIANGALGAAAARVEQTMAGMLVLVISFLARQANLGNVGQAVTGFIRRLRAPIERALDRVIAFVVAQARRLGRFVAQAGVPNDPAKRLQLAARDGVRIGRALTGRVDDGVVQRAMNGLSVRYALSALHVRRGPTGWMVKARINPEIDWQVPVLPDKTRKNWKRSAQVAGTGGIAMIGQAPVGADGVRVEGVMGNLRDPMDRDDKATPNFNTKMPSVQDLLHWVKGYRWAHAWGPGFGDEARIGMMLASEQVNNQLQSLGQSLGLEGYLRRIHAASQNPDHKVLFGARVSVRVIATSFGDPPPGVPARIGQPVLHKVDYVVVVNLKSGRRVGGSAGLEARPPLPAGRGGQGKTFGNFRDVFDEFAV